MRCWSVQVQACFQAVWFWSSSFLTRCCQKLCICFWQIHTFVFVSRLFIDETFDVFKTNRVSQDHLCRGHLVRACFFYHRWLCKLLSSQSALSDCKNLPVHWRVDVACVSLPCVLFSQKPGHPVHIACTLGRDNLNFIPSSGNDKRSGERLMFRCTGCDEQLCTFRFLPLQVREASIPYE